jgi:hypothetical protein
MILTRHLILNKHVVTRQVPILAGLVRLEEVGRASRAFAFNNVRIPSTSTEVSPELGQISAQISWRRRWLPGLGGGRRAMDTRR